MRKAVYPGSFDPVTNGHLDIIKRAKKIFDHLTIAVLANRGKRPLFSTKERVRMLRTGVNGIPGIAVDCFDGLLVDYLRKNKINIIIRGLRAVSDLEYEFQLAHVNRTMLPDIETVFLMPSEKYVYLTSSMVREVSSFGGDLSRFIPPYVAGALEKKLRKTKY
ncbi:MAG: pantetheine-phosphate adenylyltransferase [bacterium]